MEVRKELRLCEVNGELGYFHCWEHYSTMIDASPMIGGHPGGQVSHVFGIVEFKDGVRRVTAESIKFCDETNEILTSFNETKKLNEKGEETERAFQNLRANERHKPTYVSWSEKEKKHEGHLSRKAEL